MRVIDVLPACIITRCFAVTASAARSKACTRIYLKAIACSSALSMTSLTELHVSCKDPKLLQSLQVSQISIGATEVTFVAGGEMGRRQAPSFQTSQYFLGLGTRELGQTLLTAAELSSTQTLLHQNFASFPSGTICVADVQTSGKGRGKNTWTSPQGCLMFSLYKALCISGERLPFIQYVVSLAIVQAIHKVTAPLLREQKLDVRIKWPNDIYAKGLKIGGILCQSVYRDGVFHLIIGAGLNVTNADPTTCLAAMVAEHAGQHAAAKIGREVVLCAIANELELLLDTLAAKGFATLRGAYLQSWLHSNQKVILEEQDAGQLQRIPLQITGISENAYLTATDAKGEAFELHPDGNSLDFFKGLVRHKAN